MLSLADIQVLRDKMANVAALMEDIDATLSAEEAAYYSAGEVSDGGLLDTGGEAVTVYLLKEKAKKAAPRAVEEEDEPETDEEEAEPDETEPDEDEAEKPVKKTKGAVPPQFAKKTNQPPMQEKQKESSGAESAVTAFIHGFITHPS